MALAVPAMPVTYLSPAHRRHGSLEGGAVAGTPQLEPRENDDEAEKRERRRSKVLALQQRQFNSPTTLADRRKSMMPLSGLSNAQLTEHYSNCIKLSAENKINAKNAFGLHLIDYMADLVKQKGLTNFQVASSTLDASAKIYAGRVDAIHMETYKVLSGLGRGSDKGPSEGAEEGEGCGESDKENEGGEDIGDNAAAEAARKRKRAKKGKTIEANPKSLNVKKFDIDFEADPIFQNTSAVSNDGAATGNLLLAQLRCIDDSCQLLLDSQAPSAPPARRANDTSRCQPVDLSDFEGIYRSDSFDGLQICPAFSTFKFSDGDKDGEGLVAAILKAAAASSDHAFDIHAEPDEITPLAQGNGVDDADDYGNDPGGNDDDDGGDDPAEDGTVTVGDSKHAKLAQSTISRISDGSLGSLMRVLSSEPSEYSYFSSSLLDTWAGPSHWRIKAQSKDSSSAAATMPVDGKPKDKRAPFQVDFSAEVDFEAKFRSSRAATVVSKATVERYSKQLTTLPEDQHYDSKKLLQFGLKPSIMVCRQRTTAENEVEDGIANYDYANANDAENFCPGSMPVDSDDDDAYPLAGFDMTDANDATAAHGSLLAGTSMLLEASTAALFGIENGLVALPRKVARVDIDYAKVAKKVDVRKVKAAIWGILTDRDSPKSKDSIVPRLETIANDTPSCDSDVVVGCHQLQDVLSKLPTRFSGSALANLSVPIVFVCLLHLANEKSLKLEPDSELFSDLFISQGF